MKKVFQNHSEVAHVFAQRTQSEGRASRVFFEGDTIYSYGYHFPIAKFVDLPNGQTVVLFTLDGYSNSTSKHIGIVRGALSQYDKVYTYDVNKPQETVRRVNNIIKEELKNLARARKPEIYISNIMREVRHVTELQKVFKSVKVYKKDYPILYDLIKKGENYFSPEVIAKVKDNEKKRKEKQRKAQQEKLNKWRSFEGGFFSSLGQETYLRYNPNTDKVETSKHVQIEVREAKALYNIWVAQPERLEGQQIVNGRYRVNRCNKNTLIAGCHTIRFEEAERIAKELNF